jgi:hypothetical protein
VVVYICNPNTQKLKQEIEEYEATLDYVGIPCLKKQNKKRKD